MTFYARVRTVEIRRFRQLLESRLPGHSKISRGADGIGFARFLL